MQKIRLIPPSGEKKEAQSSCCSIPVPMTLKSACCSPSEKERPSWATGTGFYACGQRVDGLDRMVPRGLCRDAEKPTPAAFRMSYAISPGLYAVGNPTKESDVFVSANYKLSFDVLRRELKGFNAWILVLDTKGINVWCAAGKGTFGRMS